MAEVERRQSGPEDGRVPVDSGVAAQPVYADKRLTIKRVVNPEGFSFQGAIDLFNVEAVAAWLGLLLHGPNGSGHGGDVHIELSRLEFCDASGIRALVTAARRLNGDGRLILHGLPPQLRTAMKTVGWNDLPSLMIADRRGDDA